MERGMDVRACLNLAFESTASKFCSERGRRREHSRSYVTDAQRSAEQNLPPVGRSVKFKQALRYIQDLLGLSGSETNAPTAIFTQKCPDEIGITQKVRQKFVSPLDYLDIEQGFPDPSAAQRDDRNT